MSNQLHNTLHGIGRGIAGTPWYTWAIVAVLVIGIGFLIWDATRTPRRYR